MEKDVVTVMEEHPHNQKSEWPFVERRSGKDRRTRRWGDLIWLLKTGRRRQLRRKEDRRSLKVLDYYSPRLFYALVLVLLFSVADALLTLWLIDHGANEINPVMAYFLQFGPNIFMLVKYLFTSMSVIIVVLLHYVFIRYLRIQFRVLMQVFASWFAMVVGWELFLIVRLMH